MPTPWIEVWKAWLARVAEVFAKRMGPVPPKAQRAAPSLKKPGPAPRGATKKASPHRSGQRHG